MKKLKTYHMAKEFYKNSKSLYLKDPIRNQFDRAILSIILNLAEGNAKPTTKERKRFYSISPASLREVQAILDLIEHKALAKKADALGAFLYKLWKNT